MEWQVVGSLLGLLSFPPSVIAIWLQIQNHRRDGRRMQLAEYQGEREEMRLSVDLFEEVERLKKHAERCDQEMTRAASERRQLINCQRDRQRLQRRVAAAEASLGGTT